MSQDFKTIYNKVNKLNLLNSKVTIEEEFKNFDLTNPANIEKVKAAFQVYTGSKNGKITKAQFQEMGEVLGYKFSDNFFYQLAVMADFKGNDEYSIAHLLQELAETK